VNDDTNSEHQVRDALDDIDEAVTQITDDDIEDRLRETLRRAGCASGQYASTIADPGLLRLLL
jgi:hypothetical protein